MAYDRIFSALADPTRRRVFEALRGRPKSVGTLAAGLPVSRPAVSQHLKVLADAGLAEAEAQGKRRYYRVKPDGLKELRRYLESFWSDALSAYSAEISRRVKTGEK